jgi:hypothetical protein
LNFSALPQSPTLLSSYSLVVLIPSHRESGKCCLLPICHFGFAFMSLYCLSLLT